MSSIFPQEIESEILVRLPSKSLHRFKSVCKLWNSLISSDQNFISIFNRHAAKKPQLLFLKHPRLFPIPIHFSLAVSENQTLVEKTTLRLPNNIIGYYTITRIDLINSNSVNGVLGLIVYNTLSECDMYMWNVGTNESIKLPRSSVTGLLNGPPMLTFYSGFGYDKTGFDYKIVRVVCLGAKKLCEVFCLRKNCWEETKIHSGISSNTLWASEMCTFIDGFGYWGVYNSVGKEEFSVLSFNFGDNSFKKITVPEACVDNQARRYQGLWEYRGELAVSVIRFSEFESGFSKHYVWLFTQSGEGKDYSYCWSSLFDIDLECGPRRPVVSLMNDEVVLLGEDDGEHVVFGHESREIKSLGVCDVDHVVVYVESLVSLHRFLNDEVGSSLLSDEASSSLPPKETTLFFAVKAGSSLVPKETRGLFSRDANTCLLREGARRRTEAGSSLLPKETRRSFRLRRGSSRLLPEETQSFLPRIEVNSYFMSGEARCNVLVNEANSTLLLENAIGSMSLKEPILLLKDASSSLLPEEEAKNSVFPEEASSSTFPEEASNSLFVKEEASSSIFPEEASSSTSNRLLVKEEAGSSSLPEDASSRFLSEEVSSGLLPEEASSGLWSGEAISSLLEEEEEATSGSVLNDAVNNLFPEDACSSLA